MGEFVQGDDVIELPRSKKLFEKLFVITLFKTKYLIDVCTKIEIHYVHLLSLRKRKVDLLSIISKEFLRDF